MAPATTRVLAGRARTASDRRENMPGVGHWIGERLPVSGQQFRELTNEPVPYHLKRWWFALGGTPAYLFVVQIATGILPDHPERRRCRQCHVSIETRTTFERGDAS